MIKSVTATAPGPRDPEARRAALLEAGAVEFAALGFDGARTRSIADRAGVNQAMIRYYFGGKEGLYRAVIADAVDAGRDTMSDIRSSHAPAATRQRRWVVGLSEIIRSKPHLPAMLLREYLSGGERLTPEIMAQVGEFLATSRKVVEDGIASGELRPVDPHAFHLSLVGSLVFFFASRPWRDRAVASGELPASAPSIDEYVRHVADLMVRGMASSPGDHPAPTRRRKR